MTQRSLCILHANCQGDPLKELLSLHPDFSQFFELHHYTNYTKEPIPPTDLATADFFLYQYLGEEWEEFSSAHLQQQLPAHARSICLPNMLFKGYWPLWTLKGPIAFGDTVLNKLIDAGAQKPEILSIYLHGNLHKFVDMDAELKKTFFMEEQKELCTDIKTAQLVKKLWKKELLFYTVNHPGKTLLIHVANSVLQLLGLRDLPKEIQESYIPEYADFELPIHPQLAKHFSLPFGQNEHIYTVFGRPMSFSQYISRYIDCRLHNLDEDFIGYLQLI